MNRCYRLVWNQARRLFVVASEISRRRGKAGRTSRPQRAAWLAAVPLGLLPMLGMAAALSGAMTPAVSATSSPRGGQVTAGSGRISQSGLTTTIDQHSQNLSLNWQSFNIGADSTVNFVQPNAQSIAVNRIADANGSVILGRLNANGQVFLINPNGVLFGQGAQVNVGGLVASTLNLNDSELTSGTRHFSGNGSGSVVNRGTINAAKGGYVALLGPQVTNHGTLNAPDGSVALAGGNAVTLSFDGNRLLSLQVDKSTLNALADNRQLIVANGGQVLMSAGAKDSLLASVVNNSGTIQARTVENRAGKIVLLGGMAAGTTQVAGTLDASAPISGNGGFVETSAAHVQVADGAHITTLAKAGNAGTWLIDPTDFTIAAGSGAQTTSSIGADTLSSNLGSGNVRIATAASGSENGDIHVNSSVSWSANELTLSAHGDININADLNGSGTAKLALEYGQATVAGTGSGYTLRGGKVNLAAGDNFSTKQGSSGAAQVHTVVTNLGVAGDTTATSLQGIGNNLAGHYVLGGDIDASATSSWNGNTGFDPIGTSYSTQFTGTFDGLGHTISGLSIDRPSGYNLGLFGYTGIGSAIRNLGLLGGSVSGNQNVGGLVGYNDHGTITQAYVTGAVSGNGSVGGLVGYSVYGTVSQSYATGAVGSAGCIWCGGLVGQLQALSMINQSYATGAVSGNVHVGGLVGAMSSATISESYATGAVSGVENVGGLAGYSDTGTIIRSYATGAVTGSTAVGGLLGWMYPTTITEAYATGAVSGGSGVGGLVGSGYGGTISNSYWDTYSTGQATSVGSIATITSDPAQSGAANYAFKQSAYTGFNFTSGTGAWFMVEGRTRPFLQSEYSTTIGNMHQLQLMAMDLAATYTLATNLDASATGRAVSSVAPADASGMWGNGGFQPIGNAFPNWFRGSFDGLGHTIAGLVINRPNTDYVGLFGATLPGSTIGHVGLLGGSVTGRTQVGSLVGHNSWQVDRAYATGAVAGTTYVGGLVGFSSGSITNTYASGAVSGSSDVGGLVGRSENGTLSESYAVGAVNGQDKVGGLIGTNWYSTISQTYAAGQVVGTGADLGGLVGWNNSGTTTDSYWATDISGQSASAGGTARTLAGLIAAMPAGFDTTVWGNQGNQTTPYLLGNVGRVFVAGGGSMLYTPVFTLSQLQAIDSGVSSLAGSYALFADIDASATSGWNGGAGFDPIGDGSTSFSGGFDGLGHTIGGLTIDRSGTDNVGLFGYIGSTAEIRNVGLTNVHVAGKQYVGGLVGYNNGASINHSYVTGQVAGSAVYVGGLVGVHKGSISNSYASATVTGDDLGTGGLVGYSIGSISHSYAAGQVVGGGHYTGGLVAVNRGSISDSYATGAVSGGGHAVGGLAGLNGQMAGDSASISNSYASGNVSGDANDVGGLVGENYTDIGNSYATGTVSGSAQDVGGLVGIQYNGSISQTYATGAVNGPSAGGSIGGLVGRQNNGTISSSYWDAETTGQNHSAGSADTFGLSSADMLEASSFAGWDVDSAGGGSNVWRIYEGHTSPLLKAFMTSLTVTFGDQTATYNGQVHDGSGLAYSVADPDMSQLLGSFTGGTARNAGSYTLSGSGLYSGQQGYDIVTDGSGTLTISKATLTLGGLSAADKVYDATTAATATASLYGVFGSDDVDATLAASFADKNAGTGKTVTVGGITLGGADGGNYVIAAGQTTTADITAATLALADLSAADKVYDATTAATATASLYGVFGSDDVDATLAASFADKNAGTGKTVTVGGVTLGGADGGNYMIAAGQTTTADITAATLALADLSAANKVYDATATATATGTLSGVLGSDDVTATLAASFANKNAGTGKTVTVNGITLGGVDGGNYVIATGQSTVADISKRAVTVAVTGTNRVYDGTTADKVGLASSGILDGDTVAFSGIGAFADKNVGNDKAVSVVGIAASGRDAGNYSYNTSAWTSADIAKLAITVDAVGTGRVYDGTTAAAVGLSGPGVLDGDTVAFTGNGAFADKNVGANKLVSVSAIAASGADAGNYSYNTTALTTADITPAVLTYRANPAFFWAGQVPGGLGGTVTGLLGGDTLADATDGTLAWATRATATSPAGQYAIDGGGLSARNYLFVQAPGNATALRVTDGSAPRVLTWLLAGLQQQQQDPAAGYALSLNPSHVPHALNIQIVGEGVRLP